LLCGFAIDWQDYLTWRIDRKLNFNDFKGKPNGKFSFAARSEIRLRYRFDDINDKIYYIKAEFLFNRSWMRKEYSNDSNLLMHEQSHFDVAEIYDRKFRYNVSKKAIRAKM
jgi:hypothetical protein